MSIVRPIYILPSSLKIWTKLIIEHFAVLDQIRFEVPGHRFIIDTVGKKLPSALQSRIKGNFGRPLFPIIAFFPFESSLVC